MPIGYQWLPPSWQLPLGWAMPPAFNCQMIMPTSTAPFLVSLGSVQSQYHQELFTSNQYQHMPLPPLHMPLPPHLPPRAQFKTHNNQLGLVSIDNYNLQCLINTHICIKLIVHLYHNLEDIGI
jgi:hypothetical protein